MCICFYTSIVSSKDSIKHVNPKNLASSKTPKTTLNVHMYYKDTSKTPKTTLMYTCIIKILLKHLKQH